MRPQVRQSLRILLKGSFNIAAMEFLDFQMPAGTILNSESLGHPNLPAMNIERSEVQYIARTAIPA